MTWKKCTALAIAAGAALYLCAIAAVSATPMGSAATTIAGIAVPQAGSNVIEAGGRHGRHGGYGRYGGYGRHGWYGRHSYRRHRHHDGIGLALPLLAVPLIIESQRRDYGYEDDGDDEGLACYRRCRDYNGQDYCRHNYREYC